MPKIMQIERCDCGFNYDGKKYIFDNVNSDTLTDPREIHLIRGSNATSKVGVAYGTNLEQPISRTQIIFNVSNEVLNILKNIYDGRERIEIFAIDRKDGSKRVSRDAIISKEPMQLGIGQGQDTFNIELISESFNVENDFND